MRFLVSEKRYETPLAAGKYRYLRDGMPTGVVEQWRYTQALHDFKILRVDYDARSAGGDSYLFHLIQQPDGQLERLTYRFLSQDGRAVAGNVLFSAETLTNSRETNGQRFEEEVAAAPFVFKGVAGLGLLARQIGRPASEAVAVLDSTDSSSPEQFLALKQETPTIQHQRTRELVVLTVGKTPYQTTYLTLGWQDQTYTLWRDQQHWPLKVQRQDGLVAQATQYIRYTD